VPHRRHGDAAAGADVNDDGAEVDSCSTVSAVPLTKLSSARDCDNLPPVSVTQINSRLIIIIIITIIN